MKKLDDVGIRIDAQGAKADKAFTEIRKALDEALANQITPEELAAAVTAAKELQRGEDEAAVDAKVAELSAKLDKTDAALGLLDDIVPDKPAEPPVEPPVEPPTEPPAEPPV